MNTILRCAMFLFSLGVALVRGKRYLLAFLLLVQVVLLSGCTSALWDKKTFARYHEPADPANLRLFYSKERKDVLVQYEERRESNETPRQRSYWLEANTARANQNLKPHFVSSKRTESLVPIPTLDTLPNTVPPGDEDLYVIAPSNDYLFTLYAGQEPLNTYTLPRYIGASRRVKQVALTPFCLAIDATIVGAVIGSYAAPGLLNQLNR